MPNTFGKSVKFGKTRWWKKIVKHGVETRETYKRFIFKKQFKYEISLNSISNYSKNSQVLFLEAGSLSLPSFFFLSWNLKFNYLSGERSINIQS